MATFLATLQVAALGSAPSHILSDTPSYLRTRGALQKPASCLVAGGTRRHGVAASHSVQRRAVVHAAQLVDRAGADRPASHADGASVVVAHEEPAGHSVQLAAPPSA